MAKTIAVRCSFVTMLVLLGLAGWPAGARAQHEHHGTMNIPPAIQAEHKEIHEALEAATKMPGKTGEAARALAKVLHPHFVREEQIALPPLGLLEPLANGKFEQQMTNVLPMTDSLRAELPRMLAEHKQIGAATRRLKAAAQQEKRSAIVRLADDLMMHAQSEEQVMYPAAILVGEVVRGRMAGGKARAS